MTRIIRRPRGADLRLRMGECSAKAHAELQKQRLRLSDQPDSDIPRLPDDITELDSGQLMALFTQLNAWADFMAGQLSCGQIDERAMQNVLDLAEATALLGGWKGGSDARVAIAKAVVTTDAEVQRLRQLLEESHAYRKLIEVMSVNLERDLVLVSREITRRTSVEPRRLRADRWSG